MVALTNEERKVWADYQKAAKRAITPAMAAGTAGAGGTLVPETLVRRIYAKMAFAGPMADSALVTEFTTDTTGDFILPTVTNAEAQKAAIVAEGADATRSTVATSSIKLNPRKYTFQVPVSYELLMGGNVDFEAWLSGQIGTAFGRAINEDFTVGDGNNKPTGIIRQGIRAAGADADTFQTAAADLAETDILALFKLVDHSYMQLPDMRFMCHSATVYDLMGVRSSGERVFPLSADRRLPILPNGVPVVANNAVPTKAANAVFGVLAPLSYYISLRAGGMRANSDYVQLSDQFTLAWFDQRDGRSLFPAATDKVVAYLQGK